MSKLLTLFLAFIISGAVLASTTDAGKPWVLVNDASINANDNVTWTSDKVWVLDGYVYVESGATLTIEAGTVIKGLNAPSNGTDKGSTLIITRGAKIYAEGTPEQPIIFTTEFDSVALPDLGGADGVDFRDVNDRGFWGGVVVLGKSTLNIAAEAVVEGLPEDLPEKRSWYGGDDEADNSGVLRYISIRYTGVTVEANKELQGLTMGCVGSGTTVEYIESFCSDDDGFEFFGGTANTRYMISAFNTDDSFDYDQGFRGKHQFWFVLQRNDLGDRCGEYDSGDAGAITAEPRANPQIYNVTYLGSGAVNENSKANDALIYKEFGGGAHYNSIFADFGGVAVVVDSGAGQTSYSRLTVDGDLNLENNLWYKGAGAGIDSLTGNKAWLANYLGSNNNFIEDPMLNGISRTNDGGLNPTLAVGSPAWSKPLKSIPAGDDFLEFTDHYGAFGNYNWASKWTALYQNGIIAPSAGPTTDEGKPWVLVNDASINANDNVTWTSDKVWVLDGYVYVESGATLTIEAGTVIKGLNAPSNGTDKGSTLIITRGAKIYAEGTPEQPIIFTTEFDSVALPDLGGADGVDFRDVNDRGFWGGVVVLGKSTLNIAAEAVVEGLPEDLPEKRSWYGGDDEADNSGVLRYISIRYTGVTVEANKELQGLTMGCVGSGTTVEYIESFCSDDDGFEFFGGTANTRYMISAFNTDDSFDYDQGFRGKHQFWFVLQRNDLGDRCGEYDSGDAGAITAEPRANPQIYNVTYLGSGAVNENSKANDALIYKEFGGGAHYNSIFADFGGVAVVVDSGAGQTSYSRLTVDGDLNLENNLWYKGAGAGIDSLTGNKAWLANYLGSNNNFIEDPMLNGISRTNDGGLNPTLAVGSPAWSKALKNYPEDDFFVPANYIGAFGANNWMMGWTALDFNGVIGDVVSAVEEYDVYSSGAPVEFTLSQNYPNPFNPSTNIDFALPKTGYVNLTIFNTLGQKVATLVDGERIAGKYTVRFDASNLSTGWYIYRLQTESNVMARKMLLIK